MKSEVYSWRLSPTLKHALEEVSRQEGAPISTLLERIVADWLSVHRQERNQLETEQERLHAAAAATFGAIQGHNPKRSEQVRSLVRTRLVNRRAS
ncbi:MAG: hypothetical protein FJ147_17740 [Deltaproteobacteria bacterium]|nr:hypothetical protein [Deltaproteobacteria bacterium]